MFCHVVLCDFGIGVCWRLLCLIVLKLTDMGNTPSVPKESPLGACLKKMGKYSCEPVTKKKVAFLL